MTSNWKASWGLPKSETLDIPTPPKITVDAIKYAFLAKEWNSFQLTRRRLDYLNLKKLPNYECALYLKQPLTPPQCKIIVAYHTSKHRLAIEIAGGHLSQCLGIKYYANFVLKRLWKKRHTLGLSIK
jgi:hypothetical protein